MLSSPTRHSCGGSCTARIVAPRAAAASGSRCRRREGSGSLPTPAVVSYCGYVGTQNGDPLCSASQCFYPAVVFLTALLLSFPATCCSVLPSCCSSQCPLHTDLSASLMLCIPEHLVTPLRSKEPTVSSRYGGTAALVQASAAQDQHSPGEAGAAPGQSYGPLPKMDYFVPCRKFP